MASMANALSAKRTKTSARTEVGSGAVGLTCIASRRSNLEPAKIMNSANPMPPPMAT